MTLLPKIGWVVLPVVLFTATAAAQITAPPQPVAGPGDPPLLPAQ